ncbi:MAG: hypothetical protein GX117_01640 [Candidatus Hydrogenedentes bacterium]|nr:hypothetical protein [Candidatus Hydrogenedentota bacterium]
MIKINLLPVELRPIQRTPLPHIFSLVVLGATIIFLGNSFVSLQTKLNSVERQVKSTQKKLDALESTVQEFESLQNQKEMLQKKIGAIQTILADRWVWSEHLHLLATLTPENIWYKRIRVLSRKFTEERPAINSKTGKEEIDPKTGKVKTTRISVDRSVLEISGYAIDDETGLSSTGSLATNTTMDEDFSRSFSLQTSKITDTEFDGYPAREFTFEYLING